MGTPANSVESIIERVEALGKTTFELAKLKTLRTTTAIVADLISWLSVILMISMFVFILNIGIAFWLGELLGRTYYGFFVVAAFYFVAGTVFYFFFHKWVKKPVFDLIIKKAFQ